MNGVAPTPISRHTEFACTDNEYEDARLWLEASSKGTPPSPKEQVFVHCGQILSMLKDFGTEGSITARNAARFEIVWSRVVDLSQGLPGPAVHDRKAGHDNYGRPYVVAARASITYGANFERRVFTELDRTGYCYGRGAQSNEYFYYNPDGDFYCHYADQGGCFHGRKFTYEEIRKFQYPPDVPFRENGGLADRYE